jgi:hypothetical protein
VRGGHQASSGLWPDLLWCQVGFGVMGHMGEKWGRVLEGISGLVGPTGVTGLTSFFLLVCVLGAC